MNYFNEKKNQKYFESDYLEFVFQCYQSQLDHKKNQYKLIHFRNQFDYTH